MPRKTFLKPKPEHLTTHEQLRNLRLGVQLRAEQVKLRRLEWDTQKLALPHITPLHGDGELQVRKPLTDKDMPAPRPPANVPEFKPGMPHEVYQTLIELYMRERQEEQRRDPYNALASITAQAILEAAQEREDARLEKQRDRERAKERAVAKAKAKADAVEKARQHWKR